MNEEKAKAKFTAWLETVAYRTKLNYIRNEKKYALMGSLDEIPEDRLLVNDENISLTVTVKCGFNFQSEWLEAAYEELSAVSKQILTLHLIEELPLTEVAERIGYSYRHTKRLYAISLEAIRLWKEKH